MIRRLIAPLAVAVVVFHAGQVLAQDAFPAPLPGTNPAPSLGTTSVVADATPFGSAPFAAPSTQAGYSDDCTRGFMPLREEAEKRGKLIKAASERHASPAEACELIGNFAQSEVKMIDYVEVHIAKCGIPPQISETLKTGHKNTEAMRQKVCNVAGQIQEQGPLGPSLNDVLGHPPKEPSGPTGDFWIRGKPL